MSQNIEKQVQKSLAYLLDVPLTAQLLPWYEKNKRTLPWRETKEPYHVWLSEIMLQQTRVEAVINYYTRFIKALPDIRSLARAEDSVLLKLWEGLGYYTRVKNLKKAAGIIMEQFGGVFPTGHQNILSLPGIGDYTAGAISSICFDTPTPAVDGNVLRVITRLTDLHVPVSLPMVKKEITDVLKACYPRSECGNFTQSLMELGAVVCVPNGAPHCADCPLREYCKAHQNQTQSSLPVKTEKKPRKKVSLTVFLLICGDQVAVKTRNEKGVLQGMWEFPNVLGHLTKQQSSDYLTEKGVAISRIVHSAKRKHIFTHIEWDMTCYCFLVENMMDEFVWTDHKTLISEMALPTAFRQLLPLIIQEF